MKEKQEEIVIKKRKPDRLDLDCREAKKAGMSYGMWKAQHPHTEYPELDGKAEPVECKHCANCGKPIANKRNKIYCSLECAEEQKYIRQKEYNRNYGRRYRARRMEETANAV